MIPGHVQSILDANHLNALTFEPGSTPTSELAAAKIGCEVGQIAKSMLFKGKDSVFRLFLCPGDRRVDNKKLKNLLGFKARMATADETFEITGYRPGGVCPFGVTSVDIFIDQRLSVHSMIYPAAGTDASSVPMTFAQLKQIVNASECDVMA